jgi:hypothetical protein
MVRQLEHRENVCDNLVAVPQRANQNLADAAVMVNADLGGVAVETASQYPNSADRLPRNFAIIPKSEGVRVDAHLAIQVTPPPRRQLQTHRQQGKGPRSVTGYERCFHHVRPRISANRTGHDTCCIATLVWMTKPTRAHWSVPQDARLPDNN